MKTGSQFNLTCQFDGNPTPNITWIINGSPLDTSQPRLSVSVARNLALLQISNSVFMDTGYYSCHGINGIGSPATSGAVHLIVQGTFCSMKDLSLYLNQPMYIYIYIYIYSIP